MSSLHEIHVERLLGRRVRDPAGCVVGRIEAMHVEERDGQTFITEFLLGPAALWERLGGFTLQLPFARLLPVQRYERCIPWSELDLGDPDHPIWRH